MIKIENLKKNYGHVNALKGVSMEVKSGQIIGLAGHNGCGKTTLIKCILGLVIPSSGEISVKGKSIRGSYDYRKYVGYMPQNSDFPGNLSTLEIISLMEDLRGIKAPRKDEMVESFEINGILDRKIATLSGGTKQRIAGVLALMFDPEILIFDEPTSGLDPVSSHKLKDILNSEVKKDKSVILVSHIMSEVEQLVSHLYFLNEGLLQVSGSIESILKQTSQTSLEHAVVALMKNHAGKSSC